jgi:hypothetical protein
MSRFRPLAFGLVFVVAIAPFALAASNTLNAETLVAKHLDSLGTTQARSAVKARWVQGTAEYQVIEGGSGTLTGKGVIVSQARKFQMMLKFSTPQYRGEQFIFDGNKVQVTGTTANQSRSAFGEFIRTQDAVIKEGLLGGVLSTAWALNDLADRKPKLDYSGLKTVDGRQLHDLRYRPKKSTDLEIHLYFDPETFRHVMTVYTVSIRAGLGYVDPNAANPGLTGLSGQSVETSETTTARQQEMRYRIEERFSDFKAADGLTLPGKYSIHFSTELQNGKTTISEWQVTADEVAHPPEVDPRNFVTK